VDCPYDCFTCNAQGQCLSCNASADFRTLSAATSRCLPMAGYFDELKTVSTACPPSCATCLLASYCLSCAPGYFLGLDSLCLSSCPLKTFSDGVSCLPCAYDCLSCSQLGPCLSCDPLEHRVLSNLSSRCEAMAGYY
jgi:proprotein convertase subtilisin/kexin type 5